VKERAGAVEGEVLTFTDVDALKALQTIIQRRPQVVTLERMFAVTPRGAALINRIKADPALSQSEIRLVSRDLEPASMAAARRRGERAGAAARSPRHAAGAALQDRGRRRRRGQRQSSDRGRSLDRRRAGALGDDPQAESESAHDVRRFVRAGALPGGGGVGGV
jgi:hypothetical protein